MTSLKGKVVAITGAGGGLGRAYALYFAQRGARLVINDVGGARDGSGAGRGMADEVVAELKALGAEAVANYDSVSSMQGGAGVVASAVEAFGRIDVLINNAGILRDKTMLKMNEEMWDAVIAVHLKGSFSCSLAAAQQMKAQGDGGAIINTTSFAGLKGNYGQSNYAAAKAGIYGLTLVNALELGRFKIRVNAIAPVAKTRMTEELDMVPEAMTADHVAPMAAFLASDLAEGVTGRVFGVHGEQIFEYKMQTTDGVKLGDWTPSLIQERLAEIGGQAPAAPATAPSNTAAPSNPTSAGASAAAAQVAAAPSTPAEQVATIFAYMPKGFVPDKAQGWKAVLHWEIAGAGDYTIAVADGDCSSNPGKTGSATCVIKTDIDTFLGITDGSVDGTQAYMAGKISASNVGDLMKYKKVIDSAKARAAREADANHTSAPAAPAQASTGAAAEAQVAAAPATAASGTTSDAALEGLGPAERLRALLGLLPALAEAPGEQQRCVHLSVGELLCTMRCDAGELSVEVGHVGTPSSRVVASADALWKLFAGQGEPELFADASVTASSMSELRWLLKVGGDDPVAALGAELEQRGAGISRSAIGQAFHGDPIIVSRQEILEFAEASNDPNPHFVEAGRHGDIVAPPLFAVRAFNLIYAKALTDPALRVDVSRLLFGEMELQFHAPIKPKDLVVAKARVLDIEDKETGQVLRLQSRLMGEGEVLVDSVASFFVRWAGKSRIARIGKTKAEAGETLGAQAFEHAIAYRDDQTKLFAAASNDPNPVHLDESFAKAAGLPGIIVHGLCSMAFCSRAFVQELCDGDPARLVALKVRFSKPAHPGQTLTTRAFSPRREEGLQVYPFVAVNDEGSEIITAGVARIR